MRRNILLIVALLLVHATTAQVRFGLKAAFVGANMELETNNSREYMLPAFQGGFLTDIPLTKWLAVQPALLYSMKGYRTRPEAATGNYYFVAVYRYNYLELPVNFLYKGKVGDGKILVGFGPSLAYGIGGKATYMQNGTKADTKKIRFDGDGNTENDAGEIHANPIDIGANMLVGYEFNNPGFILTAGYTAGLLDVSPNENKKRLDRSFNISFGYLFPRK